MTQAPTSNIRKWKSTITSLLEIFQSFPIPLRKRIPEFSPGLDDHRIWPLVISHLIYFLLPKVQLHWYLPTHPWIKQTPSCPRALAPAPSGMLPPTPTPSEPPMAGFFPAKMPQPQRGLSASAMSLHHTQPLYLALFSHQQHK